jgi:predicted chitinase
MTEHTKPSKCEGAESKSKESESKKGESPTHLHGEAAKHSREEKHDTKQDLPTRDLHEPLRSESPDERASGTSGFGSIVSEHTFKTIFPHSNALYKYDGLIAAARAFSRFCNDGSLEQNRREAAAFLANISHETGGLVFVEEQSPPSIYCDASSTTNRCAPGKTYHGRGPLQLSWNYNYGACGTAIGRDLLHHPELVSTDSTVTFMTALWFWMTAQAPKPSCHDAIKSSGFGMTINVINGGIECGKGAPTPQAQNRIQLYQKYCGLLGVDPGGNLHC